MLVSKLGPKKFITLEIPFGKNVSGGNAQLQFGQVVKMLHRAEIAGRAQQGVHHPGAAVPCVAHDAIAWRGRWS